MSRARTLLNRLPWPPPGGFRLPAVPVPDPEARAGGWLVLVATAAAAAVYLVGNLVDAAALTPEFTRTILTQIGISSVPIAFRDAVGMHSPGGTLLQFALSAYAILPMYGAAALFDNPASPSAVLVVRAMVQVLNLAGGPLLYAAARRSGLRDRTAALAALVYLLSPFLADKIGWDAIGFMGTPLIGAYWALQVGRPGLAVVCWAVAAGGHPFTLWGITFWALAEWMDSEKGGRPVTALRLAAAWFPVQAALNLANVFLLPLITSESLAGYMTAHVSSGRFRLEALPGHALAVALFLAGFAFLPFARARWLVLMGADLVYYLGTGLSHGLIPATTGLAALGTLEALRAAQDADTSGRQGPLRRLAGWVAGPAARGGVRNGLLLAMPLILVGVNVLFPPGNPYRRVARGVEWDNAWVSGVRTVTAAVPAGIDLCLVQPYVFAAADGRCARVLPWSWPETGDRVTVEARAFAHVVAPSLFERRRYEQRTMLGRRDHEVRVELCDGLARGTLGVAAASGGACLVVRSGPGAPSGFDACPGLCPVPPIEGLGEFSDREPKAPVPGGNLPPPAGQR